MNLPRAHAHLALGANLGDRLEALREATRRIAAVSEIEIVARSQVYETPPWGKTDQAVFANAVLAVHTSLAPSALLEICLEIERTMGRVRHDRWGPRRIDIDLLTYNNLHISEPNLTIPHPEMGERAFVLVPLVEIAPGILLNGRRGEDILARLDRTGIKAIDELANHSDDIDSSKKCTP